MQKKLIAAAIATTLAAPAFADTANVTVYGVANVSYDLVSTGSNTAGTAGVNTKKVSSNTSRIGLKGTEDLGDGLSAIWQVESLINIDGTAASATNNANLLGSRNTYAGLKSDSVGTVLLGRHDTPYNLATRRLDVFTDGIADNRSLLGAVSASTTTTAANAAATGKSAGLAFDGRQPNVLAYISPAISGITGAAAYVAGAEDITTAAQTKGSAWSLAGWYNQDAFFASLAHEIHNIGTTATGTAGAPTALAALAGSQESATKIGFGYTQDAITAGFAYERTKDNFGTAGANLLGHNAYYLSGKYSFGNDAIKAAYSKTSNLGAATATGAKQFSLGYDHNLSKRTTAYALYTKLSNDANVNYGLSTAGTGGTNTQNGAGASPSAFSFGLKHTF